MSNKPRTCPHCKTEIPIDHGFHFDKELNLIHDRCGKIVFSVNAAGDSAVSMSSYRQHYLPVGINAPPNAIVPHSNGFTKVNGNGYDMDV